MVSHLCPRCGSEMGSTRAVRDPSLGLAVVVCRACTLACVRRRDPLVEGWRWWLRASTAAGTLVVQALGVLLLVLLPVAMRSAVRYDLVGGRSMIGLLTSADERSRARFGRWLWQDENWIFVAALVVMSIAAGVWASAGLGHGRRWRGWAIWVAMSAGFVLFVHTVQMWNDIESALRSAERSLDPAPLSRAIGLSEAWRGLVDHAVMLSVCALLALIGLPGGMLVGWVRGVNTRRRFRKRLRRVRQRRES